MHAFDIATRAAAANQSARTTRSGACPSCGAYDNSQHTTCQPGKRYKLGRSRRAARDRRTSGAILEYARIQDFYIRNI